MEQHGIYELHFEVTGNCNLDCIYCYNADCRNKTDELSLEEIKKLVKESKKYGTKKFTLTGGEPFVRPDFFEILDELKGQYVSILSNGKIIDKKIVKRLKKDYPQVQEFKISWDGFKSHDELRVGSSYKDIEKTVKLLKDNGYVVVINTIVLEKNQEDLVKLYDKLIELNVDRWRVDMPFTLGYYIDNQKKYKGPDPEVYTKQFVKIITKHEKEDIKMDLEIFNLYKSQFKPTNTITFDDNVHPCEYKRELISMKPNGDVIFCPSLSFAMSNFRNAGCDMKQVFKDEENHDFYKLKMSDIKACKGCRYLKVCGGGCRANSIYDFNSFVERDLSACTTFPFWEQNILPILKPDHQEFFKKLIDEDGFIPKV